MDTRLIDNLNGKQHDYMAPFLWLHGEEDSLIVNEIQRIYDSGIRSVCLESRVHEDFCKEGWWSDVRLIMEECRKRNMKVWILDDKRFPSGQANGAFSRPEYQHLRPWGITEQHIDIAGPITDGSAMTHYYDSKPEDTIIAVFACKHVPCSERYTEVIDITDGLHDGMVYFSLPEGMWRIIFLIKTRSGYSNPIFCDKLNPDSVKIFVDEVYEPHYKHLKEYFGNTFLGFFSDEPSFKNNSRYSFLCEMGKMFTHYPWGDKIIPALEQVLGDHAKKMLPGLWLDIEDGVTEQVRHAYMDFITEEYKNNFCNQLSNWCHNHGVEYIGHVIEDNHAHAQTDAGSGHFFRALDGQDMSGIDIVLHQIIPGLTECASNGLLCYGHVNNDFFHYYLGKLGSSSAHIDPKKKGRALCEIFGAFGWAEGTRYMKYLADHMLVRGINYFVPHAFSPKYNDEDCPPNFYDTGRNALYKYFRCIIDYMSRICYLHNDGIHIPMAAILYDVEAHWINKNRVPLELCGKKLYDNLLDYDILPSDAIEQMDENGCLNGETYPCLIVPYYEGMPTTVIEKLKKTTLPKIIVTDDNVIVKEDPLKEIGTIVNIKQLDSYIKENIGTDVTSDYKGIYLRHYHYVRNGVHSYMFSNEDIHNTIQTNVTLSAFSSGKYILYDAMENKAVLCHSEDGNISITLPPYNAIHVLFGNLSFDGLPQKQYRIVQEEVIMPTFSISYAKETDTEFTYYKTTNALFNITGRNEMHRFSGNIKYEGAFEVKEAGNYLLDLGQVGEAVEVFVNGKSVGCRIMPPYMLDISEAITEGNNDITIIVSNHSGYNRRDGFSLYLLFEPSGLLGPITLKKYE